MSSLGDRINAAIDQARAALEPAHAHARTSSVKAVLAAAKGRALTNNELAAAMGVHKSTASRRVSRLLNRGVVRQRINPHVAITLSEPSQPDLFRAQARPRAPAPTGMGGDLVVLVLPAALLAARAPAPS